jgi:GcrA cell cycle regulator
MFDNRGTWSEHRIEQLKRCFQAGLTSSQIAREIGVTRNAVIGKLSRLGLSRPRNVATSQLELRRGAKLMRPRRARLNLVGQNDVLMTAFSALAPQAEDIAVPAGGRGVTLLELSHGKCRWPIDRPDADDVYFCGSEPVAGLPYCAAHARIAYRPGGRLRVNARA